MLVEAIHAWYKHSAISHPYTGEQAQNTQNNTSMTSLQQSESASYYLAVWSSRERARETDHYIYIPSRHGADMHGLITF